MYDSDPVIRETTPDDIPSLMQGLKALAVELNDPFNATQESIHDALFGRSTLAIALLATLSNKLAGIVLGSPMVSTSLGCTCIYVSDLWVDEAARGRSLGQQLLAAVAYKGRQRWQANAIVLNVYEESTNAMAFYKHLGFKLHDTVSRAALTGAELQFLESQHNDESLR